MSFNSGHELSVHGFEHHVGLCAENAEPDWNSLFPSLSLPLLLVLFIPFSQKNK